MTAHDRDSGFNGALFYVISSGDSDSAFDVDPSTGELFVAGPLDRERTPEYTLNVTVYDGGLLPRKSASRIVSVSVLDCNDNAPAFFKSSFSFFFPENTLRDTTVVSLNATDPDAGLNGRVVYSLDTETEDFRLDPRTGLLTVAGQLDRERREFYELRVRASDSSPSAPLSSVASVRVRVLDVNDVAPAFSLAEYRQRAREDLPKGSVVGSVEARDPDLYQGGKVKYSLVRAAGGEDVETGHFEIDEVSGTIRIRKRLDYETRQMYNLTVRATDGGSPPLSSVASFLVEVQDVNENLHPPRFKSLFLRAAVPENLPAGALVATVTAADADGPDTDDGRVSYSVLGGDGLGSFAVGEADGAIRTLAPLDRESKSSYWLTVLARDGGSVPLSARLHVYVEVLDVNDNAPLTLEPVYFASVDENSDPDTEIVTVKARDADDRGEEKGPSVISFEIVAGNPQSLFAIDPSTGVVSTTRRKLDREAQAEHELEVMVSDGETPPLNSTTKVVVSVNDVNDNSPEFLESFYKATIMEALIEEDPAIGLQNDQEDSADEEDEGQTSAEKKKRENEELYKVWEELFENSTWRSVEAQHRPDWAKAVFRPLAKDKDVGENGRLSFSMKVSPGDEERLQIDPLSGVIYAVRSLMGGQRHEALVKATDGGKRWALARIRLDVEAPPTDPASNRRPPRLVEPPRPAQVFESDEVGHLVTLVTAEDPDGDRLWYSIESGDDEGRFHVSPERGSVLLARRLDRERRRTFNLTVSVTDGRHTVRASVPVAVIDVNERRPHFAAATFHAEVPENATAGAKVIKLNVSDGDAVEGQRMTFFLHAAQDVSSLDKFKIGTTDGIVRVREGLDHERARRHILTVAVRDQGTPAKTGYARLAIDVLDHNDHAPKFLSPLVQASVHETAEVGAEVVELVAVDIDRGEAGRIEYSVVSGNAGGAFSLDRDTGLLSVARSLDLGDQDEYTLVVRAEDHGTVPRTATVPVHVRLTMADDTPPRFSRPRYSTEAYEDVERGSPVAAVRAHSTSALRYEITDGDDGAVFSVNPGSGVVVTQRELDFEERLFYNLTLRASNPAGASVSCFLMVHVLDVNDNPPVLAARNFSGEISESAPVGSLVLASGTRSPLVVRAEDADSGANSLLRFEILEESARRFFAVDENTGAVRTVASLDRESRGAFSFGVRVSDMGSPRLFGEVAARVDVRVGDENDSPPTFLKRSYSEVLLLPTFHGVEVLRVEARDPDTEVEGGQDLKYSVAGADSDGLFSVEKDTGRILVASGSVRPGMYSLEVSVSDGLHSDRASVRIQVERADNSGLAFARDRYPASVLENTTKTETVAVLAVLGAALDENLRFSLLNPTDLFEVGPTSGAVRTTGVRLDREAAERHELVVEVRSADEHSRVVPR